MTEASVGAVVDPQLGVGAEVQGEVEMEGRSGEGGLDYQQTAALDHQVEAVAVDFKVKVGRPE
jgi:hypothetical protein